MIVYKLTETRYRGPLHSLAIDDIDESYYSSLPALRDAALARRAQLSSYDRKRYSQCGQQLVYDCDVAVATLDEDFLSPHQIGYADTVDLLEPPYDRDLCLPSDRF